MRFELEIIGNEISKSLFVTDAQRLKQIMINLLRNSVKFTMEGVIRLTAEVYFENFKDSIGVIANHKMGRLSFYDTGMGIQEQDINNLFKIFSKLNDP